MCDVLKAWREALDEGVLNWITFDVALEPFDGRGMSRLGLQTVPLNGRC